MAIAVTNHGPTAVLALEGRLSLGAPVDEFRSTWTTAMAGGAKNIILNLSKVTMMDSSGIGTMIRCYSAISAQGGKLKVVGANSTVRQAFKVTRLDSVFEFHDTEESALA
jgi:anti-anti-sigma factor